LDSKRRTKKNLAIKKSVFLFLIGLLQTVRQSNNKTKNRLLAPLFLLSSSDATEGVLFGMTDSIKRLIINKTKSWMDVLYGIYGMVITRV